MVQRTTFRKHGWRLMFLCDEAGQLGPTDLPVKRREEVEVGEEQKVR